MTQAVRNTRDAVSVVQTAEGALTETTSVLQRMRDLAVQAANSGSLDAHATAAVQAELDQLKAELTRIADRTTYDGTPLLDGSYRSTFQVGAHAGETISLTISSALGAQGLGVDGINVAARVDPDSVTAYPAQGRIDRLQTGRIAFIGVTASPGGIPALTGTISFDGHQLDLGQVAYTDLDADGVIDNGDRVAALNAAAVAAGFTHRPDVFVDDGDDLIFNGREPAAGATDAELVALSPTYDDPSANTVRLPASTSIPPQGGMLGFPGTTAAGLPALRGTISANGARLELGSVSYADTNGDGTISGTEALDQLNAAAKAAGITDDEHAFVQSRFITLSDDEFVDHGESLQFRGAVPTDGATPADLARLSPVFTQAPDPITLIDAAIRAVSTQRAELGAVQNRFEHTIAGLGVAIENTAASLSRIRDTDMAQEMTTFTRKQVLLQAGTAMLSQANQSSQNVLRLLQG
jgi:flagellin